MKDIGDFIEVNALNKSDYHEEIRKIIAERKPDWVIAAGEKAMKCFRPSIRMWLGISMCLI